MTSKMKRISTLHWVSQNSSTYREGLSVINIQDRNKDQIWYLDKYLYIHASFSISNVFKIAFLNSLNLAIT